ncbi:MAG: hypothetical protein ACLFWF_07910 [Alphaproteobacteria bacterium]
MASTAAAAPRRLPGSTLGVDRKGLLSATNNQVAFADSSTLSGCLLEVKHQVYFPFSNLGERKMRKVLKTLSIAMLAALGIATGWTMLPAPEKAEAVSFYYCPLVDQYVSGRNRTCIYRCSSGKVSITIDYTRYCPPKIRDR